MGDQIAADIPSDVTIDLSSANITAEGSSDLAGFDDPRNILNHTDGVDAAGKTWLLADDTAGYWQAAGVSIGTFSPALLRLSNTQRDGRGTKAFTFTSFPENGFANFTYTDPQTGKLKTCAAQCPLASSSNKTYPDFFFVHVINMDGLRLNVSEWYGAGGGLDGLLLAEERKSSRNLSECLILMTVVIHSLATLVLRHLECLIGSLHYEHQSISYRLCGGCYSYCHSTSLSIEQEAFFWGCCRHSHRRCGIRASPRRFFVFLVSKIPHGPTEDRLFIFTQRPPFQDISRRVGREQSET